MLILAVKPGHDGGIAAIDGGELTFSLEAEKDSFRRYVGLTPSSILAAAELCDRPPDVVALGGWYRRSSLAHRIGAGYRGDTAFAGSRRLFGNEVQFFSSTHERSHIMMAIGLAPPSEAPLRAVLVWEGYTGSFFLLDEQTRVMREIPVLTQPGVRYSQLFGLADPGFPETGLHQRFQDSGKLMALAAYGRAEDADKEIVALVDRLMEPATSFPVPKSEWKDTPVYNAGVTSPELKTAAALLSRRLFERFAQAAEREIPPGTPLYISGGCGLNCDWNQEWRRQGHFSSVFVPPCTNDSGSAIGTGVDALFQMTGRSHIGWSVYAGREFDQDVSPDPANWRKRWRDYSALARALADGRVIAWVQGRWEIGPRALGHRSLLAEPFSLATRDRLNRIKRREDYRPIAPCCRIEDVPALFDDTFDDPYMLYFRRVISPALKAVTHVDGTARVQTVRREDDRTLHALLTAFAAERRYGVLCNTSLNFHGRGFINRMSDLVEYCEATGVNDMVVGDIWYERVAAHGHPDGA